MQAIVLSFTLEGQSFDAIKTEILFMKKELKRINISDLILIDGFMPRKEIEKRGFSTEVNDFFDETFPIRLNMYNNGVLREEMAKIASKLDAIVYVIGEVSVLVEEEVNLYAARGVKVIPLPLLLF